jgi:hypothetical protein
MGKLLIEFFKEFFGLIKVAISSWQKFICFIFLLSIPILILLCFIKTEPFDINKTDQQLIIKSKGKIVSIINVPAFKLDNPSGIYLDKQHEIKIKASGMVSTGRFISDKYIEETDEIQKKLILTELKQQIQIGWRNADGTQNVEVEPTSPSVQSEDKCFDKISEIANHAKIMNEAEYGTLLGVVFKKKEPSNFNDLISSKTGPEEIKIFSIGFGVKINFSKEKNRFLLYPLMRVDGKNVYAEFPTDVSIPDSFVGSEIYLVVNDSIPGSEAAFVPQECINPSNDKEVETSSNGKRLIKYYEKLTKPQLIWFLDNEGFFNVYVEETPVPNLLLKVLNASIQKAKYLIDEKSIQELQK